MKHLLSIFNSSMKKFFLHICLFIPFTIIVYSILIAIWGDFLPEEYRQNLIYKRGNYGHTLTRLDDAKKVVNNHVLFLGSSHAYRGFDVRFMFERGINAFNLGTSAQTAEQTEHLLNRYIDSIKPKMVIMEVAPKLLTLDGVESTLDIYANDFIDLYSFRLALRVNHLRTYNTFLYALYRDVFNRNTNISEKKRKGMHLYRKNGYVERDVTYFKYKTYSPRKYHLRNDQILALKRIVSKLKIRNIPYYLVEAPVTKGIYNRYKNHDEYKAIIKPLGEYFDFNQILNLDDSLHFYDAHHLNQHGVEIFNQKLIDTLRLDERWN